MHPAASADPPLRQAAHLLPRGKRRIFDAAYAAMRAMDDAVDEDFLRRPAGQRAATRAAARRALARHLDDAFALDIARADPRPWRALATALSRDVAERPVRSWSDFRAYALGAAVAPALVFLHILGGRPWRDWRRVVPIAVFSYLTHILRDLRRDADAVARDGAEQRLTVPLSLLAGLPRRDLAAGLHGRAPAAIAAVDAMLDAGNRLRPAADAAHGAVRAELEAPEAAALDQVCDAYKDQFAVLVADPDRIASGRTCVAP